MSLAGAPSGGATGTLVGRRSELAELRRRLPAERLLTLTGEPGCGTTTLAVAAVAEYARAHPEPVHTVHVGDLAADDVVATIAMTLEVPAEPAPRATEVATGLRDRSALLLLDGCERHVDLCAAFVDALLTDAPEVRVVVTSRQVLGVRGETVLHVDPLSLPARTGPSAEEAIASDAVALFVDRATDVRRTFRLTDANAPAVTQVCAVLEGNALAIVLAASRMTVLSPEDLLDRLEDRFRLLTKAPHDAPERHRSLRASVELSHALCSEEEQRLWARMSVLPGTVDLEGVEQVCSGDGIAEHDVLDLVDGLLEKGVLVRDEHDPAQVRYRLPAALRAFGVTTLGRGEVLAVGERHLVWSLNLARENLGAWFGPRQPDISRRLRAERPNLRHALLLADQGDRAVETAELAAGLAPLWVVSGDLDEGRAWLERAAARDLPDQVRLRVGLLATWLAVLRGETVQGRLRLEQARSLVPDPGLGSAALQRLDGALAALEGRDHEAEDLLRSSIETAVLHDDVQATATGWYLLAVSRWMAGKAAEAVEAAEEARALTAAAGETHLRARVLSLLGVAAMDAGDSARAERLARAALSFQRALGEEGAVSASVDQLTWVAASRADHERTAALLGVLDTRLRNHHAPVEVAPVRDAVARRRRAEEAASQGLGRRRFEARRREGAAFGDDDGLRFVLDDVVPLPAHDVEAEHLTPREVAVAELVGRGLSNRDIGLDLGISERTAQGHVQNILRKLGFTSRTQVAAWVADRNARGRAES